MRLLRFLTTILLASAALPGHAAAPQSPPRDPGGASAGARVSGIVRSAQGPVVHATLTLTSATYRHSTTESDEQGRFVFAAVPEGLYSLKAARQGYFDAAYGATHSWEGGTPIRVARGQRIDGLRVTLTRGGVVRGTLRGVDGQPAGGVRVMFAEPRHLGISDGVVTDAAGAFVLDGLREGERLLMAEGKGLATPTFFPGVVDARDATRLQATPGTEAVTADFSLIASARVRVSGIVLDPDGHPYDGARLWIRQPAWDPYGPSLALSPGADGRFAFTRAGNGPHTIEARGRLPADARLSAFETIHVADRDVTGVTLRLRPLPHVSGRVQFDGRLPAPPDLTTVRVFIERDGYIPVEAKVNADATFAGDVSPAAYRFRAYVPEGLGAWHLQSATAHGRDVRDATLDVTWDHPDITGLVLTFSDRYTELSGVVSTADGQPTSACTIVVFPVDRERWLPASRRLATTRPATDGHYSLRDLPPGEYFVAAAPGLDREWQTPERLERLVPASLVMRLGDGETRRLNLRYPVAR